MIYAGTSATVKVSKLDKRYRMIAGGTSASKTISIELNLIHLAHTDFDCTQCKQHGRHACLTEHKGHIVMDPKLTSIVSESMPHLRKGAMRDFINIMIGHGYFKADAWNKTMSTYTFETGSEIEFFSADQSSKVRGPRRDRLFVNELNNVAQESWEQLALRTREVIYADWNPVSDFYAYEMYGLHDETDKIYADDDDTDFLILTYKDNQALEPAIVKDIEKRRKNAPWFKVYGEGKRGELEGRIFKDWQIIDTIPHEARLVVRGLDFGYARDKATICDIYYYSGGYIVDEMIARTGMLNRQLADQLLNSKEPNVLTIADSAEQKSIAEMREYGCNIIGVQKVTGKGMMTGQNENFTNSAIQWVQSQRMSITKRSTNYLKSYRTFNWQTDRDGNIITKYDHFNSDEMMSVIYGMTYTRPTHDEEVEYTTGDLSYMFN